MEGSGGVVPQPQHKSSTPVAGGVLLLIGSLVGLIFWAYYSFVVGSVGGMFSFIPGMSEATTILLICGAIGIIFSIVGLLGAVMAIQRKKWVVALVGSILCLFTLGFFFVSSILGLIALILIAISKNDFV